MTPFDLAHAAGVDPLAPADSTLLGVTPLGVGLGQFITIEDPPIEPYVEGILSGDGGGFIGGEEKLGKTFYMLDEGTSLALGLKVCGRFAVPTRRKVLLLEEEDSPRRTRARLRALLRGRGIDPLDPDVQAELDRWFRLEVWEGFTFDDPVMVQRLEATLATFEPAVVYIDVLRKVTLADLNKADQAGALLAVLDNFRRRYNTLFRVLHHYRKVQGFRVGRGSQELGGSFVLGAWAENSLFFEPIGREQGAVRVVVQSKDAPASPAFRLRFEAEGPPHAPTIVRLLADDDGNVDDPNETLFQALATLPPEPPLVGKSGASVHALAEALKRADKTIRRGLKALEKTGRVLVVGQAAKGKDLWAVTS